jgi:hypothetical protein
MEPVDVFNWTSWGSDVPLVPHDTAKGARTP